MVTSSDRVDYDLKLAQFKINGYVVLPDMICEKTLDEMHEAFIPMLDHVRQRQTEVSSVETGDLRTGRGRQNAPHRYTMTVPWQLPFTDPAVVEHPMILEFLERYWGTDDFVITCLHSNNPYPGTGFQRWHRDTRLARHIPHQALERCPVVGIKFPLLGTSEENGSIEVLPSTQYLTDPDLEDRYDEVLRKGEFPSAHRLNLDKGSMWVQDVRMLHRGTPNRSDHWGPEIVICFCLSWFAIEQHVEMTQEDYDKLSDRSKKLHRRCVIVPNEVT